MINLKFTLILLFFTNLCLSQAPQTKSELESKIKGTWYLENDSKSKIEFSDNFIVKRYYENELRQTNNYEIVNSCGGERSPENEYFLKETDQNGNSTCFYIESINYDNNGIFSMMTQSQGKVVVLKKIGSDSKTTKE